MTFLREENKGATLARYKSVDIGIIWVRYLEFLVKTAALVLGNIAFIKQIQRFMCIFQANAESEQ